MTIERFVKNIVYSQKYVFGMIFRPKMLEFHLLLGKIHLPFSFLGKLQMFLGNFWGLF